MEEGNNMCSRESKAMIGEKILYAIATIGHWITIEPNAHMLLMQQKIANWFQLFVIDIYFHVVSFP